MRRLANMARLALALAVTLGIAAPAGAHPAPFSFLDVRIEPNGIALTVVAHAYDLSHDLGLDVEAPRRLLEAGTLEDQANRLASLLAGRIIMTANGRTLSAGSWSSPEPLHERQSVRLHTRYTASSPIGSVSLDASLFPYDPEHQTFVNFYDGDELASQAILTGSRSRFEYFTGSRQGTIAVVRKFLASGLHHIMVGPDHLLFLVGLLLLGGSLRQLTLVVSAFTVAHSVTLSAAALNFLNPPAYLIEPAIALSIVFVGADNLLVRDGRDMRGWIAFSFGFIHGFGFASVLREMDLPARALGLSLFSFNLGVEIGQLAIVVVVASALTAVWARSESAGRRLAFAGSIVVMAAGAFWFIQRVFFTGGLA